MWRLAVTVVALLAGTRPAGAIVPGRIIDAGEAGEIAALVLPGVEDAVRRGMRVEVIAPRVVRWRRAYAAATERYANQVTLGPDGALLGYVAGLPFPQVDLADPQAGLKLMWNYTLGPWVVDDSRSWGWEWQLGRIAPGQPMVVEAQDRDDLERAKFLRLIGRTEVSPLPALPGNRAGILGKEILGQAIPLFLAGQRTGPMLTYHYGVREAETWWIDADGKTRRLLPQSRYTPAPGTVVDLNTIWGFNAPLGSYTFRVLGERTMLGTLHARRYPVTWCPEGGDFAPCEVWEERPVYVIEAAARKPYDGYSKRIIVLDRQAWLVLATDLYDRQGRLWKTFLNFWSYRTDERGRDPEEYPYVLAATCLDRIENRAHRWRLPGTRPLADTVAINQGLTDAEFSAGTLEHAR